MYGHDTRSIERIGRERWIEAPLVWSGACDGEWAMKNITKTKLHLQRQTIRVLTPIALAQVPGGIITATTGTGDCVFTIGGPCPGSR